MLETGGELDLAEEALHALPTAELGANHLQSHQALVTEVAGEIDCGHPAGADLAFQDVPVAKSGRETLGDIAHGGGNLPCPVETVGYHGRELAPRLPPAAWSVSLTGNPISSV
jgi:hypothetical protein